MRPPVEPFAVESPHARGDRGPRALATLEAIKGVVAIAAGLGLLGLVHRDLHPLAASLIGHIGLDPGGRYPTKLLDDVDRLRGANVRSLLIAVSAYAAVRFVEAWGLWRGRAWGEWLGAVSGALYLPFEFRHLVAHPTVATALVIALNLAVVVYLACRLRARSRAR